MNHQLVYYWSYKSQSTKYNNFINFWIYSDGRSHHRLQRRSIWLRIIWHFVA